MNIAPTTTIDPFGDAFLSDPYAYHEELRELGPVLRFEAIGTYGVTRFAEVSAVLADHVTFSSARGVGITDLAHDAPWRPPSLLIETDPPLHDRARGIMNRIVSLRAVKALRPEWEAKAEMLVDRLVAQRTFDAATELGAAYPLLVFPDTIGIRKEGREHLLDYAAAVFDVMGPRNAVFERSVANSGEAIAWVAESCRRENLEPGGWGMAVYEAADRGECSHDEAERLVRSFLSAGVDTTVNGLSHLLLAFATFPAEWDRLLAKPELQRKAFEESLRWDTTLQLFFRTTTRPTELGGTALPAGAKILVFLGAANRDPRRWPDPGRFDIDRATSGHVGFGFGVHQCLGQMVARLEGEIILGALMKRVRSICLAGMPVRRLSNTMHAMAHLPVEVTPMA